MSEDIVFYRMWLGICICVTVLSCVISNNWVKTVQFYTTNGYYQVNDVAASIHWVK